MREFPGRLENYRNDVGRAISALVYDAVNARKPTFAIFRDIRLEVYPKDVRSPSMYASDLTWTFYAAANHPGLLGKRSSYTNAVPELRKLAETQMHALPKLDVTDMRAAVRWLVTVAPATHCDPCWLRTRGRQASKTIRMVVIDRQNKQVHPEVAALRNPIFRKGAYLVRRAATELSSIGRLTFGWTTLAKEWLEKVG